MRQLLALVGLSTILMALPLSGNAQTGLVVTANAGQLTLNWTDNSSDETAFLIERARADLCEFTQLATVVPDSVTYVDAALADNERWCYRVRAQNDVGFSAYSNVACGTVPVSGGGTQTASQTFTRTSSQATYAVPLGIYTCRRLVGATNRLQILKNGVVVQPDAKGPTPQPPNGAQFTIACTLTSTAVTLVLDGVVKVTVAP